MNESKKELAQYLKLNYGLHYKNKNFVPSQTVVDEKLELEKYTDQILIYEPIQDNSSNNTWDLFFNKYDIKNDEDSLEFEKIQDKLPLLAKKDVKLLIPVLRITYFGNVKSSIVRENYQEFLAREVLVGGFLIIRDALLDNSLEFDRLKAHISWAINEARWECKNLLKSAIMHSKVENIEDSNGNPINDIKTLTDYLNQLYKFETPTIISYEKVVPIEQKMNDSLFNVRLIPGITNHHKEITMECWTQDNIYLNLPFWIKEYQLNHGMVVTSYGLVPGIKPALDFLSVPSIKRKRKIRLKASLIRNELLHSKIYIDELNLENLPFLTLFDTASTNVIQCNIFHGEVVINIWEKQKQISEPSQQLVEDIKCALNDINPYKSLKKVFSEYGHVICTEITMGGRLGLGDSTVNEKAQEEFRQYLNCIEWSEWSDTIIMECKDLLKKLNMGDQKLIAYNNSETNLNELNTWLNNTSKKPNSWSLVDQPKLISLCEIFHEDIKRQIQNLLENKQKILMTGVTKLSSSKIRYYRVEFENYLLTSDDYQIIGSIIVNNERFDDLSVKFHMKSISGFSIIIKEYKKLDKKIEGDLKVIWQLIGKPKSVGYFSKHTRNNEVFNTEFETEIPEQKISLQIDVKEELSPDFIIATSIQYPPTNYEYMLQVVVKSWSGNIIDLDIINFDSFDDTPDKASIQLYVINPNQQESVIADFGSEQVLWKLIGHKLEPDMPTTTPPIILPSPDISEEVIEGLAEVQETFNKNDNNLLNTDDDGKTLNQTSNVAVAVVGKAAFKMFTASLAAVKPFLPWIESVFTIINNIVNQYETVEYNKKTCLVLVERVEIINLSVKSLTRRSDENLDKFQNEDYYHSFIKLEKVLKLVKDFIGDISELKGYRKFILAANVKSKANQLLIKLEDCCNNLQFSIIISQETRTREQKSLDGDVANMTKFLKSIDAGKETSRTVNRICEEVAVFSQLITNLAGEMKDIKQSKQTIFSVPIIPPKELYDTEESVSDIPTNSNNVVKKLLRNAIPVACKTLDILDNSPNEPARIKAELSILNSIQSSNKIIKFHGKSEINGHPVLVFDWAKYGNLKGLYERESLSWVEKLKIAHDIASGLVFLQACQIFHHDIRCENILITGDTRCGTYEAKIAKFRQSRELHERSFQIRTYSTIIRWLAPEIMPKDLTPSGERYTFKCEIFSYGMLLWELGAQKVPYKNMEMKEIMYHVHSKKRETFEDFNTTTLSKRIYPSDNKGSITKGFTRIIDSAWAHEPKQRPTINNIYQELDSLMELNSRKRLSSQSLQSVSYDSNNITTPEEDEDNLTTLETILTLEEGIAAHINGKKDIAWKCFEIHATLGDPLAIYWKAYYYLKGYYTTPSTPNTNEAIKHFKQAADANVPEAQYYYARALEKAKKPAYLFLEYFTKAADNDNVLAQRELGRIYYYGLNGVEKNEEKGILYLKLAALKNNQNAINDLKTINLSADDKKSVEI